MLHASAVPLQAGDGPRSAAATATDGADGFLKARAPHVKTLGICYSLQTQHSLTFKILPHFTCPTLGTQKGRRLAVAGLSGPLVIPKRKKKARLRKRREKTCAENFLRKNFAFLFHRDLVLCATAHLLVGFGTVTISGKIGFLQAYLQLLQRKE